MQVQQQGTRHPGPAPTMADRRSASRAPAGTGHSPERTSTVRVAARYPVAPRRTFDAWLEPGSVARFLFATALHPLAHVEIEPRVAGAFRLIDRRRGQSVTYQGRYVAIEPPSRIVFTLDLPGAATLVSIELRAAPSGACDVALVHEGVPASQAQALADRWDGTLYGLGTLLDADLDTAPVQGDSP